MRILLPVILRGSNQILSPVISGGIEKFAQTLLANFPNEIIPIPITSEDRKRHRTAKVLEDALDAHSPDILFVNDVDEHFFLPQIQRSIPTISVIHEPLSRDIRYLNLYPRLQKFTLSGGHLYFVSQNQMRFFQENTLRVTGLELENIQGTVRPAHVSGLEKPAKQTIYSALTIGRTDALKDPFYLHRKLQSTGLVSCVLTNKPFHQRKIAQQEYTDKNAHWQFPQETYRGLEHRLTLQHLSAAACYVSTCQYESWGITAMEALAHGVPLVLITSTSKRHSSMEIAASPDFYRNVAKGISTKALVETIEDLIAATSHKKRMEISHATKAIHSKEAFVQMFQKVFARRLQS